MNELIKHEQEIDVHRKPKKLGSCRVTIVDDPLSPSGMGFKVEKNESHITEKEAEGSDRKIIPERIGGSE